jgi:uncharacterized protein
MLAMRWVFLVFLFWANQLLFAQNNEWNLALEIERAERDAEFANPESSILSENDLASFHGLSYFPISEKYRVAVKKVKKFKRKKVFEMTTTTDRRPLYRPFAVLFFEIDGIPCQLTVYQNLELMKKPGYEDYLFIPFTDLTSGDESYGGGRYLDFRISDLKEMRIDFNKAYNPYCAYNPKYSCPIPPSENALNVRIEAGVKKFHD